MPLDAINMYLFCVRVIPRPEYSTGSLILFCYNFLPDTITCPVYGHSYHKALYFISQILGSKHTKNSKNVGARH
jgi:hypothetical protein